MRPALAFEEVTRSVEVGRANCVLRRRVLRDVSFAVWPGELVAIDAAPASGATTLLHCAAGLLRPSSGTVHWFGAGPPVPPGICYLGERPAGFSSLTVQESLQYHRNVGERCGASCHAHAVTEERAALERLDLLSLADAHVGSLGAAALRRVAIAQLLLARPRIALLDGTLDCADPWARSVMHDVLRELLAAECAVVVVTRLASSVAALACRIHSLRDGTLSIPIQVPPMRIDVRRPQRVAERA